MKTNHLFIEYLSVLFALFLVAICQLTIADENQQGILIEPSVKGVEVPKKILFIGNSFTYFNGGIGRHLQNLASSANPPFKLVIDSQTTPNQTLKGHYFDSATKRALYRQDWDIVVVQGASYEPVDQSKQQDFFEYARRLNSMIKASGAQTVFFMTWPWRNRPEMTVQLRNAYVKQGNEIDALVVPVGLAWEEIQNNDSSRLSLYSDQRHSNLNGTYLAACVFYAALFKQSPAPLSYTAGIDQVDALYLRQVAMETTRLFYSY